MRKQTEFYNPHLRKLVRMKWAIDGYDNYCFADDKRCYNRTTGIEVKRVLKAYTQGYNLASQFHSLKKLKPLLKLLNL